MTQQVAYSLKKTNMIKAEQAANSSVTSRIDALASALGFSFERGTYIKNVQKIVKKTPHTLPIRRMGAGTRRRVMRIIPSSVWEPVHALEIGESCDVSESLQDTRLTYAELSARVRSMQGNYNYNKRVSRRYHLTRSTGGRLVITRTA